MEAHPFMCPASRCTYGFTEHVTKAYVSDLNQIMVAYLSMYGDFSPTLYKKFCEVFTECTHYTHHILINPEIVSTHKKKTQISNFMKIHPAGAQLFLVKGQTDMTTLSVAFAIL
jgi:hypothetical protein